MAFDPFKGFIPDAPPSIYDVQRRQKLADQLLGNKVQNGSQFGVLADALAGTLSGYENTQAANEAQSGYTDANKALGAALSGDMNPSDLIQAGGNPFLPQSESGLVGDLIKRKLGIGETYYGTPQVSFDAQGQPHYSIIGSLGTVKEITPPQGAGGSFAPKLQISNTGTAQTAINPYSGAAESNVPINNAQAEADKSFGSGAGKLAIDAPEKLQVEGQLVQTLDNQHKMVDQKVDQTIQQLDSVSFPTGVIGNLAAAVPGTPQYDLAQNLQTIKANVGFDTLQNMRQNSPTGGALGQISNMEEQLLQAVNGSLEQGQTKEQLKANLQSIKTLMAQVNALKHQSYESDKQRLGSAPAAPPIIGGTQGQQQAPAAPSAVVDYSTYFGGGG